MKNIIKLSLFLLLCVAVVFSCKKEDLDTGALTDFPPGILSVYPSDNGKVDAGDFDVVVKFISGSVSTLASTTVKLTDDAGNELASATKALSSTSDSLVIDGSTFNADSLPLGFYKLEISVTDTKGKTQTRTTRFEIYNQPQIGIIGSATPGGWDADTDMTEVSAGVFEIVLTLVTGEAKFRADDAWAVNWGGSGFPSGVGTQDGPNIPITAGTYRITFNPGTGAYNFTSAVTFASRITDLYLLGSFNNFEGSAHHFNLVADNTWVLDEIALKPGELFKFSEGPNFMGKNWGDNQPDGIADEFGNNIVFAAPEGEAFYKVTFNDKTRAYTFEFIRYPSIGILGSATPTGWDSDTDLEDKGNGNFETTIVLIDGEVKFRANDTWDTNWGGTGFPSGTAELNGPNIVVTAGTYKVTFNPTTLQYSFVLDAGIQSIGIIGSATPSGWDADTDLQDNGDGTYSVVLGLLDGEAKFRANDAWDTNWGAAEFPTGTGVNNGANIAVTKGLYVITFNPTTGEYSFAPASVGIIGSATPGGWDSDTDMTVDANNPAIVTISNLTLVAGEAKFRVNDDWKFNWGGPDFPSGIATPGGANIPVAAGTYTVTFNVNTGEYSFQ